MIGLFKPLSSDSAKAAVAEVLESGWIGQGPKTEAFEKAFAEYVGSPYAVATNSATSALHLATVCLGLGPGDEILTTPMTFVSTNHAIMYQGATPVFVDVEPNTLNLDLDVAAKLITAQTKAIMVVHYAGLPLDIDKLYRFAGRFNLKVIQDAAHACGASFRGVKVGAQEFTCFSFHAVKNLPLGDGGMITVKRKADYEHLRELRWVGIDKSTFERNVDKYKWEYNVGNLGFKYHMNDINAAIGLAQLPLLDTWNTRRREIANMYKQELPNVRFLDTNPESAQHLCVIRISNRDEVHKKLAEKGIDTGVHYTPNTHYSIYKPYDKGNLIETEQAYSEILSLPLHLGLSDEDVYLVSKLLKNFL